MTLPMAAWRVTYTPGNWLVLSGPTMMVVMLPAPARVSPLINELWSSVVAAQSVDALLKLVGEMGLSEMPDFGAFFWDAKGLHGLARGGVRVVDTDTGEVALEGQGSITWNEESLGGDRRLRIDLEPVDQDEVLQLPLVVGAAAVSAIYLTTASNDLVRFPSYEQLGVIPKMPVLGMRPRQRRQNVDAVVPVEAEQVAQPELAEPAEPEIEAVAPPAPQPAPEPEAGAFADDVERGQEFDGQSDVGPARVAEEEHSFDPDTFAPDLGPNPFSSPVPPPSAPEPPVEEQVAAAPPVAAELSSADVGYIPAPETAPPAPIPPTPPAGGTPLAASMSSPRRSAPVVIPPNFGEVDDDAGGTIFSTGLAATHKPAPQQDTRQDPQVLAVPCVNGHANAPGSRACRVCQGPVDSSNPRLIRRPTLAGVHSNQGDFADIVSGVIIGRGPDTSHGPEGSQLMKVPSPSNDISRNHVLVTTREWNVHVTDLNSTNGTTVLPVGETPFILRDGASVQVELGTVLDLGDGVSVRIEPPRG